MTQNLPPPALCLNCGTLVDKNYCPHCGQEKSTPIVPAGHLLRDVVDEFFLLDAKLFKTLRPLIAQPGFLTNEYISGRRVRYLSPFRLYFVISALYFLAFSFARYDVSVMHALAYGLEQAHHAHVAGEDTMHMTASAGMAQGVHALHHVSVMTPATDRVQRHNQAVRQTTNWFLKNQSLITFFLVPIAALLLKLLYYRTRRLYIEHLVFAVHIQSFLFAILLLALLPYARSVTYLLALGCSAVYLYLAMRAVYKQRASTTLIRCGVMLVSYGILMTAAAYFAFLTFYYRLPLWHLTGP